MIQCQLETEQDQTDMDRGPEEVWDFAQDMTAPDT